MSKNTRCPCGHTPGARRYFTAKIPAACACDCHAAATSHAAYGPTPVTRTPSKATGQVCPLVIRHGRGVARHVPGTAGGTRWFSTGRGR